MEEQRNWTAEWIWAPPLLGEEDRRQSRVLFRKSFEVADSGSSVLAVQLTADSKYRFYVNGQFVGRGPCKGDKWSHYYDTFDLTPYLSEGINALAIEVVHYPIVISGGAKEGGPLSESRNSVGGLWLQGSLMSAQGELLNNLDTGDSWKLRRLDAVSIGEERLTLFVGGTETVQGDRIPVGWNEVDYDDSEWESCNQPAAAYDRLFGQLSPWQLKARPIPPLREREKSMERVMRSSGAEEGACMAEVFPLVLNPGDTASLELDAGAMTTGYPMLEVAGGRGAAVSLLYSEAYEYTHPELHGNRRRDVRDDPAGKELRGNEDVFMPAGYGVASSPERYEPMGRRAFRFIRLAAKAGGEQLVITGLRYRETGYPLEETADFRSSDPQAEQLWAISLNTLRNCMQDSYEDTPYYEQMQYVMDAKSQALFTYMVSADDRLARKTLFDFHSSISPTGMLQSRYPSVSRQIIPGFALYWVQMVRDHYAFYGDLALVRGYLSTADAVLGWFDRLIGEDGLVGKIPEPYWAFIDWVEAWREYAGTPSARWDGPLTVYNLMYIVTLEQAAELNDAVGRRDTAMEYRERAQRVRRAVAAQCYDASAGYFCDGPASGTFSQHAQLWAVLAGVVEGEEATALMERMLDSKLAPASFSMMHYLFRALAKTGLYDRTAELWDPWRMQLALHLTAWVEDPVQQRSDCHGWGALPLYEYTAEILGVRPELPGYAAIRIEPRTAGLTEASGTVATAKGAVRVVWRILDGERFVLEAETPGGVPVVVVLPDGSRHEPVETCFKLEM